jgi:signal transduction histidine kinase
MEALFQPFYTTKKNGMGLGLSICQEIIRNHGGEILVKGGKEGGAIFTIRLPEVGQ